MEWRGAVPEGGVVGWRQEVVVRAVVLVLRLVELGVRMCWLDVAVCAVADTVRPVVQVMPLKSAPLLALGDESRATEPALSSSVQLPMRPFVVGPAGTVVVVVDEVELDGAVLVDVVDDVDEDVVDDVDDVDDVDEDEHVGGDVVDEVVVEGVELEGVDVVDEV